MSLKLSQEEKGYLADICEGFVEDWPGVEQDAPRLYETALKFIDWVRGDA